MEDLLNLSGNINSEMDALGIHSETTSSDSETGYATTTICEVGCFPMI
ncbi:hypothetical protein [Bacillus thuringiensis]|nr:hypothetical protein [Bacillus thuringiensis]EEM80198.1 hypothetical protein bthur0011_58430 [Bacillus thuringiensis serovar huazhongensis BGSC 4BD1]